MEGPPPQYTAKTLDDYLEHLSKGVFQAGISWRVVEAKWPSITKAFHGFDVERVARMSDRNERAGGFKKHLKSFSDYEELATDLKKRFKFVGDSGVYHFLWTVKHPVPDWHEWSRAHGMNWEAKAKAASAARGRAPRSKSQLRTKSRASTSAAR
ncbi:MAG: hypothetical protein E6I54_11420 [Chloroflexi bacterium]|nr:MAG: hypothetical protein E6I54_11420 [Chloroflexota bacterium]